MTISAKIIADSISPKGIRLTTLQLRYPRFIHSELMTHRSFSRNASSSRAIPVKKLIEDVRTDPVYPSFWGKNQPGMQANEESVTGINIGPLIGATTPFNASREDAWDAARERAIQAAEAFADAGYHKQIVNRLLEPFSHINVVVTATEWDNWDTLRLHPDAQPEIQELARQMNIARDASTPAQLANGNWHLPYVTDEEIDSIAGQSARNHQMIKVSAARCARVSYLTHDGRETTIEEDEALYEKLCGADPKHLSPLEHQATPDMVYCWPQFVSPELHGNFYGWVQYRKLVE